MKYWRYVIFHVYEVLLTCWAIKFEYISTEHPVISYVNPKYSSFLNVTAKRYGRNDPFYYVDIHLKTLQYWHNNVSADIYFYEWLTNQYKRGFVEMHFKLCDFIHKDKFFGSTLKQGVLNRPCPYPPAEYHLYNMTIPVEQVPPNFPFRKGRIYMNMTATDANELIVAGHIDMEIKLFNSANRKNKY